MKKIIILSVMAFCAFQSCKKDDTWVTTTAWTKGQKFVLNNNIKLVDLKRNDSIPTEPFTVDYAISNELNSKSTFYYYMCHSSNNMAYQMPSNNCKLPN